MERGWKPNVETSPNCPRCASSNTKFCYYNNYSLTQPRYFCKSCRRYWTKGGSLRNVPVGGGCRKTRRGRLSAPNNAHVLALAPSKTSLHNSSTSSSSMAAPDASTIDLALVYANFLNRAHQQAESEIPEFPNPSLEFSSVDYTYLELDTSVHQLECLNPSRSAMEELDQKDGDGVQQCSAGLYTSNYYGLPPLPSQEVPSQQILWSYNSQLPVLGGEAAHQDHNLLIGNWGPFDLASDDAFPGP